MKNYTIRIVLGIIASTALMAGMFYFFLFINPLRIHQANLLQWIPILICAISMYVSGRINSDTPIQLTPLLFISFVIFDLFNFFYLPFIFILLVVGILALITARNKTANRYKVASALSIIAIFTYFALSQPLIFENEGFGRNADGKLINATVLWDFSDKQPPTLPSHTMLDQNGNQFDIKNLKGKTYFIAFWATWCDPCLKEKPQLEQLKTYFKYNSSVEFVDISLDDNSTKWKEFLNEHRPQGKQLISQNINETKRTLNISGLPLHFIVNPDGTYKVFTSLEQAAKVLKHSKKLSM